MILHTPDILKTEASIVRTTAMGVICKITKLSGMSGEPDLWLYNADGRLTKQPTNEQIMERMGLQVYVDQHGWNVLLFNTWHPHAKIVAGDSVTVYFHGGEAWRGVFLTGALMENKRRRNLILLQNNELSLFTEQYVNYLEILNHRTGRVVAYSFLDYPNVQYKNAAEGEKLLQIMVKRVLGAKQMMARSMLT